MLFKVHRALLERQSVWFRDRFESPADALAPGWVCHVGALGDQFFVNLALGSVSSSPPYIIEPSNRALILENVSVRDFEAFLSILYPK
jgi:hypothetical protein